MLRKLVSFVLLPLAGALCALLVVEIGLTFANHLYPYFYCYDAARGWGLRPGGSGFYSREGRAGVAINREGFRDREHSVTKPPGVFRVAVLGDSYVQAIQVPSGQTFCSVLEKDLNAALARAGRTAEVMNFGVDGYGTAQELITLREKAWRYHPDLVVLAFFPGNDVRNNSVVLEGDQCRPFYVYRDGELALAGPFIDSRTFRLWCMSRFDYRTGSPLAIARNALGVLMHGSSGPSVSYPVERAINYQVYKAPQDQAWRDAWQVTDGLITTMHHEVSAHGARLLVVDLEGVRSWPDPRVRRYFTRKLNVSDLSYPDTRMNALGEADGFEVLNLAPPLQRYAAEHRVFLHGFNNTRLGFGHWNALGHKLAGDLIARKIITMLPEPGVTVAGMHP